MNANWRGFLLLVATGIAFAGSGSALAAFKVDSYTIDGGGGRSAGVTFVVTGSIGQPDADPLQPSVSASGQFSATGGFFSPPMTAIFGDGFE